MEEILGSMPPESKPEIPTIESKTEVDKSNPAAKKESENPAPPKMVRHINWFPKLVSWMTR